MHIVITNKYLFIKDVIGGMSMNIFDKVKKGMRESTKTIKELSSDVTEMTRLKVALSKEREQIEESYFNLGKLLYEAYIGDEEMKELPKTVKDSLWEIKQAHIRVKSYETKLESLKGIVKCNKCGVVVEEGANYCYNCGNQLLSFIRISDESDVEEYKDEEEVEEILEDDAAVESIEPINDNKPD
jgi:hypothetical protein